nr:hypothetical protein L204_03478 [Cryptococcus depauperatus CBS 7855]
MMKIPNSSHIEHVYRVLAEREALRRRSASLPKSHPEQQFYAVDNSCQHRKDNRYANILAYDRTAVKVNGKYLNANVVEDGKGGMWIAAQAPLPQTFDTFFKAIYTGAATGRKPRDVLLVQLTGFEERGIVKADPYMSHKMKDLGLHISPSKRLEKLSSVTTEITLEGDRQVAVHHYHFDAWPDHGVPKGSAVRALKALVEEIEDKRKTLGCEVWVHCSAGIGRTMTFIALSSLLNPGEPHLPSLVGPFPRDLQDDRVARTVDTIRECRGVPVQTMEQLRLIYDMQGVL